MLQSTLHSLIALSYGRHLPSSSNIGALQLMQYDHDDDNELAEGRDRLREIEINDVK